MAVPTTEEWRVQRDLKSGGIFLSAMEHWMASILLSKRLLTQNPSSTTTSEHSL